MSWLSSGDPQALLALQSGLIDTPTSAGDGSSILNGDQEFASLGDPIPVVWARWRDGAGGVLLSPPATEVRYEDDIYGNINCSYHLLLGEGPISPIEVRDVFSGTVRAGTFNQSYNRRAGTWLPGNSLTNITDPEVAKLTQYCGSIGTYPDCSTLSYSIQSPPGDYTFKRRVNAFIRGGVNVTRLADGVYGPSDNFADLIYWLMQRCARIPASSIDVAALTATAIFLERNEITCNCIITEPTSIPDLIASWGPYFLVTESRNGGKLGLRPLLPTDNQGNIMTSPIEPAYYFTIDNTDPDSLEINYSGLATRQAFVAQTRWRQQLVNDLGIDRVLETRIAGTAPSGPYELHDLSAFATREIHAARAGAFHVSRRHRVTHTARWSARLGQHADTLITGAIVRLILPRETSSGLATQWNHFYQIDRITKGLSGVVTYEATHWPTNASLQSIVALDVLDATGTGILLTAQRTGVLQDVNSSTDSTVPPDVGIDASSMMATSGNGGGGPAGEPDEIPNDPKDKKEEKPESPADGPKEPGSSPARNQYDPATPPTLSPIECDTGEPPVNPEWYYKPPGGVYKRYSTTPDNYSGRKSTPIVPIVPNTPPPQGRIMVPGGQFYAKYYCPEPGDPNPTAPENTRYTKPYEATDSDFSPFFPYGGNSLAFKIRILRNDGPILDPLYWQTGVYVGYHHTWLVNGTVWGYMPVAFDYYNIQSRPENPQNDSDAFVMEQGPSIIGYEITHFYMGPTADLPQGSITTPPPSWIARTWDNDGNLVPG